MWAALAQPNLPTRRLKSGLYYSPNIGNDLAVTTMGAGNETCLPFDIGNAVTIDRIGIEVTTFLAATFFRLGVRSDDTGYPGSLLLDAGQVDASSNGFKEIVISLALVPGKYWVSGTVQGAGNINVRGLSANRNAEVGQLGATFAGTNRSYRQSPVTGVLPVGFSATVTNTGEAPYILMRAA